MSDFDAVLERLLTDPGFTAALAADPAAALAGYQLSDDERQLLYAQVSTHAGADRRVERRTSKASLFGLLSPLTGGLTHDDGIGHSVGAAASEYAGQRPSGAGEGFDAAAVREGFGTAGRDEPDDLDGIVVSADGPAVVGPGVVGPDMVGPDVVGPAAREGFGAAPPADYHPNVDVDGDGTWDRYTVRARGDGGLDVVADSDHDGRPDFVGHDDDRDGVIDRADYDTDGDGRLETHMVDSNGDGWMDRTTVDPTGRQGLHPAG